MREISQRLVAQVDAAYHSGIYSLGVALRKGFRRLTPEGGATAVEYGLIVALIAAGIIIVVGVLGDQIYNGFCAVVTSLGAFGGTCAGRAPGTAN